MRTTYDFVLRAIVRGRGGGSPDGRRRLPTGEVSRTGLIRRSVTGSLPAQSAAWALLVALLPACSGNGDQAQPARPSGDEVVVAAFNFPESALLAEIYARALETAGIPVRREPDLGPRELVQPALLQGLVDLVPEYLGTALASLIPDPVGDPTDTAAVKRKLSEVLTRWNVRVLDPAPAQNQNGLAVTRETAERLRLHTVSDLRQAAPSLTLGAPPECPSRAYCLQGFERVYGLQFARFLPFETERQRVTALRQQLVDVALMFTTDGELAGGDLVLLEDDRRLQPAENVVPVVSGAAVDRHERRLVDVLGSISATLTTQSLTFLNWRVAIGGKDVKAEARGWLERHDLLRRPG